ncbi:MAG: carotenoid 1,2-hydratase [Asgard group archaeon]|nr:carotenoid 1,2-hydratase [Asgard group archaeon]
MNKNTSQIYLGTEEEHYKKEGLQKQPEIWEDGQRVPIDRNHFEWWYFDAELEDGSILVIIFGPKPFFDTHFPIRPLIAIDYTDANGNHYQDFYVERKWEQNYSSSKEQCNIQIKDNYFKGDLKKYKIKAKGKRIEAELELINLSQPWRPGTGFLYFKKENEEEKYFAWFPSVPFGKVTGTLTIDGKTTKITGRGYHDHNWGNTDPCDLFDHWYWSRSHIGDYILLACDLVSHKSYGYQQMPYVLLLDKQGVIADDNTKMSLNRKEAIYHPKTKKNIYNLLEFSYHDTNIDFTLGIQRKHDLVLQNLMLLNSPNLFFKQIGKNPWYHRFAGESKLEIKRNGKEETISSSVVYELMYYGRSKRK